MNWAGTQKQGFTIVELLIVIVVIGILAAITVVAFNGVQGRAKMTAVTTDLVNTSKKIQLYNADNGSYPTNAQAQMTGLYAVSINKSLYATDTADYNWAYCTMSPYNQYALTALTADNRRMYVLNGQAVTEYTGSVNWNTSGTTTICDSVLSGSSHGGITGWRRTGTADSGWRTWVGP